MKRIGNAAFGVLLWLGVAGSPSLAQQFDVDPSSIDYGAVTVGERRTETITVTNTGNQTFTIQSVTRGGSSAFGFQQPGSFPIGPGQFWNLDVHFQPPRRGSFNGSVRIQILNGPLAVVALAGSGIQDQPRIRITPRRLDFGALLLGREESREIRISNDGNDTLQVLGITSSSAIFVVESEIDGAGGFPLEPGTSRTSRVSFRPIAAGTFMATLRVASDDPATPEVSVEMTGRGELPPIDFAADLVPDRLRVSPGGTVPVTIRLENLGDEPLEIRTIRAVVEMPDGSTFPLAGLGTPPVTVAGGAIRELATVVFLPEAFFEALGGTGLGAGLGIGQAADVHFVQTFSGSANGIAIERQAHAALIPVGSLSAEFTVHTLSIDFPFAGTSVAEGGVLRARAHLYGRGSGSVIGRWLVDGFPFESVTVDLDGRQGLVQTLGPLPTSIVGGHDVALEIFEPAPMVTPSVRYLVTARNTEGIRWLEPPAFGAYLRSGKVPSLAWTPRAGALYYLTIDGSKVETRRTTSWRPSPETWSRLAAGSHQITVRAVIGAPESPLFEERIEQRLILLDAPITLDTECDAEGCSWTRAPGQSLYAVEWRDEAGDLVYRRLTARAGVTTSELTSLLPGDGQLSWRVEAKNDLGDVVARNEPGTWPRGER